MTDSCKVMIQFCCEIHECTNHGKGRQDGRWCFEESTGLEWLENSRGGLVVIGRHKADLGLYRPAEWGRVKWCSCAGAAAQCPLCNGEAVMPV